MKIQALDIQVGDRIFAYCNNKQQACTVNQILDPPGQDSITLMVFTSEHRRRSSVSYVVRFRWDALVALAGQKSISQTGQ